MVTKPADTSLEHAGLLMQAVGSQYGMLQSARGATISESSSRAGLSVGVGAAAAAVISLAFLRHQWVTWMHVAKALPMTLLVG